MQVHSHDDRGEVEMADVLMTLIIVVFIVVTAPIWWHFIGMITEGAGPFTSLLLQLFIPLLIISLIASVAVSARRVVR